MFDSQNGTARTLFANEEVIPVIRVVCISGDRTLALINDPEVELCCAQAGKGRR